MEVHYLVKELLVRKTVTFDWSLLSGSRLVRDLPARCLI